MFFSPNLTFSNMFHDQFMTLHSSQMVSDAFPWHSPGVCIGPEVQEPRLQTKTWISPEVQESVEGTYNIS